MKLFEIKPTGDPFNKTGWDVLEYQNSFKDKTCTFHGDLSPIQGRNQTIRLLRRLYPECKIKVRR